MNIVCLTGRLTREARQDSRGRPGWRSLLLEIRREAPGGAEEPGVLYVSLALPPPVASRAESRAGAGAGDAVSVVGMLDVDVDYSAGVPRAHYSVIAERIEALQ